VHAIRAQLKCRWKIFCGGRSTARYPHRGTPYWRPVSFFSEQMCHYFWRRKILGSSGFLPEFRFRGSVRIHRRVSETVLNSVLQFETSTLDSNYNLLNWPFSKLNWSLQLLLSKQPCFLSVCQSYILFLWATKEIDPFGSQNWAARNDWLDEIMTKLRKEIRNQSSLSGSNLLFRNQTPESRSFHSQRTASILSAHFWSLWLAFSIPLARFQSLLAWYWIDILKSPQISSIPGSHNDPRFASKNNPFDAHPIHSNLNNFIRFGSLILSFDSVKF